MIDGMMDINEVFVALQGYAILSAGRCGKQCNVIIGNAGRDMMGTRTFKAMSFETIVRQVKKAYGPLPEKIMRTYYLSESDDMPRVSTVGGMTVLCFIHQQAQDQPVFSVGEVVSFTRPWNSPLPLRIASHTANPLHRDMLHTVIGTQEPV